MRSGLISILVAVFNEEEFVCTALERVIAAPLPPGFDREIIVVDDGSTDDSAAIVEQLATEHPGLIRIIKFEHNRGKTAAIRAAIGAARGEFCIVQDADLEYDPRDYRQVFEPLVEGLADAVYGSRFAGRERRRVLYFWHAVANRLLTLAANVVADLNLTDVETCYKAFRTPLLKSIPIRSRRFGFEPEITIKLAKREARIYEVPISYCGRTYEEGKKIGFIDALHAVWVIAKCSATGDIYVDAGGEILDAFSVARRFNRWMAGVVSPFIGRRVLEIGAGMGNITRELSRRRERYVASDIDKEHLDRLRVRMQHRPNVETMACDLQRPDDFLPLKESMDTVVCLNVLEHVEDDATALDNIFRTLVPGGRAVILVPHGRRLFGKMDAALGHIRRYSKDQLRGAMAKAGFEVERMIDFNRASWPLWFLKGRVFRRSRIGRYELLMFDRLVWLWRLLDRVLPWPSVSIIAVGVRPKRML